MDGGGDAVAQPTKNAVFGFLAEDKTLWYVTESNGLVHLDPHHARFTAFDPPVEHRGSNRTLVCLVRGEDGTFCGGETVPLCHSVVDGILDISMSDNFGGDIRDGAWVDLDSSRGRTWRWRRQQPVTQRP